jgi:hypothetical protein
MMKIAGLVVLTVAGMPTSPTVADTEAREGNLRLTPEQVLRREKCRAVWQATAPWSYSRELSDYFVAEHERQGIAAEWWYSLAWGKANFGLTLGKRAPGLCYGPMDVKWPNGAKAAGAKRPDDLRNPYTNIRAYCSLAGHWHRTTGRSGFRLLAITFYPARPHEYPRWRPVEKQHQAILTRWYAKRGEAK